MLRQIPKRYWDSSRQCAPPIPPFQRTLLATGRKNDGSELPRAGKGLTASQIWESCGKPLGAWRRESLRENLLPYRASPPPHPPPANPHVQSCPRTHPLCPP